ncbi:MAG: hypothetical protein NNA20_04780 [Nitrospira sp.]|nr:hypothetical protein [Nitrospira sp.]MCP9441887.1 hypothetical protein [Nitrospira sp.]
MWPVVCCVAVAVGGVGGWHGVTSSIAMAQSRPMVAAGLPYSGMVTDVRERMIEIDGRLYACDPKVEVFDDDGNEADFSAIVKGAEVRFRLKQDDLNKIDRIVVYLPR